MNLALEKGERVTMRGKGRCEIRGETREVTEVVVDVHTTDSWERYGWGMTAGKVEVLLVVSGLDVGKWYIVPG